MKPDWLNNEVDEAAFERTIPKKEMSRGTKQFLKGVISASIFGFLFGSFVTVACGLSTGDWGYAVLFIPSLMVISYFAAFMIWLVFAIDNWMRT